jgi:hypothetical protein
MTKRRSPPVPKQPIPEPRVRVRKPKTMAVREAEEFERVASRNEAKPRLVIAGSHLDRIKAGDRAREAYRQSRHEPVAERRRVPLWSLIAVFILVVLFIGYVAYVVRADTAPTVNFDTGGMQGPAGLSIPTAAGFESRMPRQP